LASTGSTGEAGDVISFLGNAAMDEFIAAWGDYRTFYDNNLKQFDPTTADSYDEWVRQARQTASALLDRLERLAEAHAPLPQLFEAEIARGGIPDDEVDEVRELITAYGTWIEYERKENEEFLDCLELDPKAVVACLAESVATTSARGDEVALRIFELQESLYGVTASPST
jgi:hypothetical protein